jgi:hypothetical protein
MSTTGTRPLRTNPIPSRPHSPPAHTALLLSRVVSDVFKQPVSLLAMCTRTCVFFPRDLTLTLASILVVSLSHYLIASLSCRLQWH